MRIRSLAVPALLMGIFFIFAISCVKEGPREVGVAPDAPAVDAQTLWSHITQSSPYTSWRLFPGKGKLYKGTVPHGALLTTYVNKGARKALADKTVPLPNGAIIVKENYSPKKELKAITVMYKVAGYNPKGNDWYWAKYTPGGKVLASGSVPMCIICHKGRKVFDYIMTSPGI